MSYATTWARVTTLYIASLVVHPQNAHVSISDRAKRFRRSLKRYTAGHMHTGKAVSLPQGCVPTKTLDSTTAPNGPAWLKTSCKMTRPGNAALTPHSEESVNAAREASAHKLKGHQFCHHVSRAHRVSALRRAAVLPGPPACRCAERAAAAAAAPAPQWLQQRRPCSRTKKHCFLRLLGCKVS